MSPQRPRLVWRPQHEQAAASALGRFAAAQGFGLDEYDALWRWSVSDPVAYWSEVWKFAGLEGSLGDAGMAAAEDMAGVRFFPDGSVNVAENLLGANSESLAVVEANAAGDCRRWTFGELRGEVERVAAWLRQEGVGPSDVVAAVLPNRGWIRDLTGAYMVPFWVAAASAIAGAAVVLSLRKNMRGRTI